VAAQEFSTATIFMLKKRLIFTLLYNQGQFVLSRNFSLQKVGDINWLDKNYDFSRISFSIDELIVLDVSRGERNIAEFSAVLRELSQGCFVPISAGGGLSDVGAARSLLRSGADKIILNSALYENENLVNDIAREFGQQCVVASIDAKRSMDMKWRAFSRNGTKEMPGGLYDQLRHILGMPVGEIYLNSMDRDGTGQGFDLELLSQLPADVAKPVILAGGAGNGAHLVCGLQHKCVDAVATANLLNFVGDGLSKARKAIVEAGISMAHWDMSLLTNLRTKDDL